jgi:hypothetical protein
MEHWQKVREGLFTGLEFEIIFWDNDVVAVRGARDFPAVEAVSVRLAGVIHTDLDVYSKASAYILLSNLTSSKPSDMRGNCTLLQKHPPAGILIDWILTF